MKSNTQMKRSSSRETVPRAQLEPYNHTNNPTADKSDKLGYLGGTAASWLLQEGSAGVWWRGGSLTLWRDGEGRAAPRHPPMLRKAVGEQREDAHLSSGKAPNKKVSGICRPKGPEAQVAQDSGNIASIRPKPSKEKLRKQV